MNVLAFVSTGKCASQGILRDQDLPIFQYLARDSGEKVADRFSMHELPSGYNFVPLQQQAGSSETDDPGLIRDWKKSTY